MSNAMHRLIAIAILVLAGATAAGANQHDVPPAAALAHAIAAGDLRPASDVVPPDLGAPGIGNTEQPLAKTGLWSSVKNAAKKVGRAVKSAAKKTVGAVKSAAKAVGGAVKTAAKKTWPVVKKIIKVISKLPKPGPGPGPGPTIPTPRR